MTSDMPLARLGFAMAILLALTACAKPDALTETVAADLIKNRMFKAEPIYAEVPRKVVYGPRSPRDAYDEKAVNTLRNLQKAGLITVAQSSEADSTQTFFATVTDEGFPILGTMPSARGQVYRGRICSKKVDGIRNFIRHPSYPTVGHAEIVWHYENPTPLYDMFETRINKPLNKPFVSAVSFYWKDHGWRFNVTVKKAEAL